MIDVKDIGVATATVRRRIEDRISTIERYQFVVVVFRTRARARG
jgi:hypothetical protein